MPARRTSAESVNNIPRTYHVDRDVARALRLLAAELDLPQSKIVNEAVREKVAELRRGMQSTSKHHAMNV